MSPKSLGAACEPFLLMSAVPAIGTMVPPVHAQQTSAHAQLEAQTKVAMAELVKRRTQRPVDKNIPEGVEDIIIGDGVQQYKRLREVERKLDAVMMRKRIEFHNARRGSFTRDRILKIWVSNTVENQPWQGRSLETDSYDFIPEMEGIYKVKIEGRLMDEEALEPSTENGNSANDGNATEHKEDILNDPDSETPGAAESNSGWRSKTKLSHFFKAIAVDFGRGKELQVDNSSEVEWKKPAHGQNPVMPPAADFDCLEFERKSEENINCTIKFYRDEYPERFRLSEALAQVLDTDEADRDSIIFGIWDYVKAMDLQPDDEKRLARCDERLWAVSFAIFIAYVTTLIIRLLRLSLESEADIKKTGLPLGNIFLPRYQQTNPTPFIPPPPRLHPLYYSCRPPIPQLRSPSRAHHLPHPRLRPLVPPRTTILSHPSPILFPASRRARRDRQRNRRARASHRALQGQTCVHVRDEPRSDLVRE